MGRLLTDEEMAWALDMHADMESVARVQEIGNLLSPLQDAKTLKTVGEWLNEHRYSPISGWHLATLDVEALLRGEMPE